MKYEFIKTSPTGNMTVLVRTPVPRGEQPAVAASLMDYESVNAEQAGFLEPPPPVPREQRPAVAACLMV